jgi:DNA-binding winged helix-turn-helix (wHTH) protein/tetratricopeptide (TPR) repeat protein
MPSNDQGLYGFGPFRLDSGRRVLTRGGVAVALTPKVFDTLQYLVENPDRVIGKDEILGAVWAGRIVEEGNISQTIFTLRKALGGAGAAARFIVTVPGRGYRFAPSASAATTVAAPRLGWQVGREAALQTLEGLMQRVLAGDRQVVFITGEAGIGKTTLVEMALQRLSRYGAGVLWGRCTELFGTDEAFLPLIEALEERCRGEDGPLLLAALRAHAPTWLAQMPAFLDDNDRTAFRDEIFGATRERMLREFCDLVEVLGADRLWVIVIEDLHWSDLATLDVLSRLARRGRKASVLVMATYRPAELAAGVDPVRTVHEDLQIHHYCSELALDRLTLSNVRQYLAERFDAPELAEMLAERVFQRTLGQPLFLVSVVDDLVARGAICDVDGGWRLAADDALSRGDIPHDLRVMIGRRIDRLGSDEQGLLEIASAVGAEFSAGIVAGAIDRNVLEVERAFDGMARYGDILSAAGASEWPDGTVSGVFAFRHALYQDVLYERLAPALRVETHRRLGERLERGYAGQTADIASALALHFLEGRRFAKAVRYLTQIATVSAARFGNREAVNYLTRALDLVGQVADANQPMLRIELLQQRGWVRRSDGDFAGALEDLNRMIACAADIDQLRLEVMGLIDLSRFSLLFSDRRQCLPAAERALARSRGINDNVFLALVQGNLAIIRLQLKGWRDEDAELCRQAVKVIGETRDPKLLIRRDGIECTLKFLSSDYRDCSDAATHATEFAQETGDVFLFALYNTLSSTALLHLGQWRRMQRNAEAALAKAEKNANPLATIVCRLVIGLLHVEALDFAGARTRCEETYDVRFETSPWVYFFRRIVLAKACLGLRDYSAAWLQFDAVIKKTEGESNDMDSLFYPYFCNSLCEYHLEVGELAQAHARATQLFDFTSRAPDRNYLALAHRVLARIAFVNADFATARRHLSAALAIVETAELPLAAWKIYGTAATLYAEMGEHDKAADYLRRGAAGVQTLAADLRPGEALRSIFLAVFEAESARL